MWRWTIRVYVSLVFFWVLLFCAVISLKELAYLLTKASFPWVSDWFGAHTLLTALLAGLIAGQVPVDSRLTGEGWFRAKDGKSFEGFKLDALRPWTWLIVTPVVVAGITALFLEESWSVFSFPTLIGLYDDLVVRNCSDVWAKKNWFDNSCNVQLVLLSPWVASIGYSIAPAIRKRGSQVFAEFRNSHEVSGVQEVSGENLKKVDSE
jgi:hypothetical protein